MIVEITNTWNNYLCYFNDFEKDIYFTEQYAKLYETENEKAYCYIYCDGISCFLFPFLRRSFEFSCQIWYDFETPYGYGGPIYNTKDLSFISSAWKNFVELATSNNYVCGFVRFHPIINNTLCFDSYGKLIYDRKTIAIHTGNGIDYAWQNEIHTKNRNVINKGMKSGLSFEVDKEFCYIENFIKLYKQTMDRIGADDFYYFDDEYFHKMHDTLDKHFLGVVKLDDKIISAAIFLSASPFAHYHLAGSDEEYFKLSPNNFLIWETAKYLSNKGIEYIHLGGGTDGSIENSLFQFKQKFSKSSYDFYIGKIIFNEVVYNKVVKVWEEKNPGKIDKYSCYLLKYKY